MVPIRISMASVRLGDVQHQGPYRVANFQARSPWLHPKCKFRTSILTVEIKQQTLHQFEDAIGDLTRTRIDMMGRDADGNISCVECKSSETAPLTRNQKLGFPEIEKTGATVVGKGKPGFTGGTRIPPTRVDILRPDPTL